MTNFRMLNKSLQFKYGDNPYDSKLIEKLLTPAFVEIIYRINPIDNDLGKIEFFKKLAENIDCSMHSVYYELLERISQDDVKTAQKILKEIILDDDSAIFESVEIGYFAKASINCGLSKIKISIQNSLSHIIGISDVLTKSSKLLCSFLKAGNIKPVLQLQLGEDCKVNYEYAEMNKLLSIYSSVLHAGFYDVYVLYGTIIFAH